MIANPTDLDRQAKLGAPPQSRQSRASSPLKGERIKRLAKKLRKHATPEETWLWAELRALKHHGFNFRRQVILGKYIVDFASLSRRVVIELDGNQHGEPDHLKRDQQRDTWLENEGFLVLRFWNAELHQDIDSVVQSIFHHTQSRSPSRGELSAERTEGVTAQGAVSAKPKTDRNP